MILKKKRKGTIDIRNNRLKNNKKSRVYHN